MHLLVLPVVPQDRCIGVGEAVPPEPISVLTVPYIIWSESSFATKPNKSVGVQKAPAPIKVPGYLKTVTLHQIVHRTTHCGGLLSHLLTVGFRNFIADFWDEFGKMKF